MPVLELLQLGNCSRLIPQLVLLPCLAEDFATDASQMDKREITAILRNTDCQQIQTEFSEVGMGNTRGSNEIKLNASSVLDQIPTALSSTTSGKG